MLNNPHILNWIYGNKENLTGSQEDEMMNELYPSLKENKNKYGEIGENLFAEYLDMIGVKYERQAQPMKMKNFKIDFETDDTYYEIKTRRYNMKGTAGEKILNVLHKYRSIATKKKNGLKIILIAYQEIDNQGVFDSDEENEKFKKIWSELKCEYIKFSDLIQSLPSNSMHDSKINIKQINCKSPLKWAGGKTKLLNNIIPLILKNKTVDVYIEPFIGGGSIFIELMKQGFNKKYILNDINTSLINLWKNIKDNTEELIQKLQLDYEDKNTSKDYYQIRDLFNEDVNNTSIDQSARFIYLNKIGFHGLYRVNKSGKFNVPYGKYKNVSYDYNNLRVLGELLNHYDVEFYNVSYEELQYSDNSITYFDPPYFETFSGYDSSEFDYDDFTSFINNFKYKFIMSNIKGYETQIKRDDITCNFISIQDRINSKHPNNIRYESLIWN